METAIIIISLLAFALLIIGMDGAISDDSSTVWFVLVSSSLLIFAILAIALYLKGEQPKAIDVYKGRTTLEITYKNGVPIDSTVVWKSK